MENKQWIIVAERNFGLENERLGVKYVVKPHLRPTNADGNRMYALTTERDDAMVFSDEDIDKAHAEVGKYLSVWKGVSFSIRPSHLPDPP